MVLVSSGLGSGCYNQVPQTGWLINNRHLFFAVLEAESPRPGCQHGQALESALFCVCLLLISLHDGKKVTEFSGVSFMRALEPRMRVPALLYNYLPNIPPPVIVVLFFFFK